MAKSQRTTEEGSGSGDLANTGAVRAYLLVRVITTLRGIMGPCGRACCVSSRAGGGRMSAGAMREGRQSVYVPMAGQEQGSRRAAVRREERRTEGRARTSTSLLLPSSFSLSGVFVRYCVLVFAFSLLL